MIYTFHIGSEDSPKFKVEIDIDASDTFLRLRNAILDAAGYSKDQMDSFFICDEHWNMGKEITYADMGKDSDDDIWLMEDTPLEELIEDEGQRLVFVFDYLTDRNFFLILKEITPGKSLHDPLCKRKEGTAPREVIDIEELLKTDTTRVAPDISDLDENFYGDDEYNEEDIADLSSLDDIEQ